MHCYLANWNETRSLQLIEFLTCLKGTFIPKMLYCDTSLPCTPTAYIARWMSIQTCVLERDCSYRKMLYCDTSRSTWRFCAMPAQKKFVFPRGRHPGRYVDSAVIGWIKLTPPSVFTVPHNYTPLITLIILAWIGRNGS